MSPAIFANSNFALLICPKSESPRNTSTYSRTLDERRQRSPNRSNNGNSPRGVTRMTPITTMP
jgi:hypothetical protein